MKQRDRIYKVVQTDIGASCRAAQKINQNSVVFESTGSVENKASKHSVQIDEHRHLLAKDDIIFCNHSFKPNCNMKVSLNPPKLQLVALRDIEPNEDLMFNYNTTEWELSCPFKDRESKIDVTGVKYLDAQEIEKVWPQLSDWIKTKIKNERSNQIRKNYALDTSIVNN